MLQDLHEKQRSGRSAASASETRDVSLAAVLSTMVAVAVITTAYLNWRADVDARRSDKPRALVLQCVLVETAGFVLLTVTAIAGAFLVRVMPY